MGYRKLLSDPRSPYINLQTAHENLILNYEQNQHYQRENPRPFVDYPYREEINSLFYTRPESANAGIADAVGMPTYQELKSVTWLDTWHDINNAVGAYSQIAGNALNLASLASNIASAAQGLQWMLNRPPPPVRYHVNPRPTKKNPNNRTVSEFTPLERWMQEEGGAIRPGDAVLSPNSRWNPPPIDPRPHWHHSHPHNPLRRGLSNQSPRPKWQRPLPEFPARPC